MAFEEANEERIEEGCSNGAANAVLPGRRFAE